MRYLDLFCAFLSKMSPKVSEKLKRARKDAVRSVKPDIIQRIWSISFRIWERSKFLPYKLMVLLCFTSFQLPAGFTETLSLQIVGETCTVLGCSANIKKIKLHTKPRLP